MQQKLINEMRKYMDSLEAKLAENEENNRRSFRRRTCTMKEHWACEQESDEADWSPLLKQPVEDECWTPRSAEYEEVFVLSSYASWLTERCVASLKTAGVSALLVVGFLVGICLGFLASEKLIDRWLRTLELSACGN